MTPVWVPHSGMPRLHRRGGTDEILILLPTVLFLRSTLFVTTVPESQGRVTTFICLFICRPELSQTHLKGSATDYRRLLNAEKSSDL